MLIVVSVAVSLVVIATTIIRYFRNSIKKQL